MVTACLALLRPIFDVTHLCVQAASAVAIRAWEAASTGARPGDRPLQLVRAVPGGVAGADSAHRDGDRAWS